MLLTNLDHLETISDMMEVLEKYENVMICCGRMGPMCIPVYLEMEKLQKEYTHVTFRDLDFDIPTASFIKSLPECEGFMGLPFTVYFKNGKVVAATTSIQTREEIVAILDRGLGTA